MNKKTQMWIGVAAVVGLAYWIWNKNTSKKEKVFANLLASGSGKAAPGCKIYTGSCNASVGTIITAWEAGGVGIVVASNSQRCIVCPKSDTPTGMPKEW